MTVSVNTYILHCLQEIYSCSYHCRFSIWGPFISPSSLIIKWFIIASQRGTEGIINMWSVMMLPSAQPSQSSGASFVVNHTDTAEPLSTFPRGRCSLTAGHSFIDTVHANTSLKWEAVTILSEYSHFLADWHLDLPSVGKTVGLFLLSLKMHTISKYCQFMFLGGVFFFRFVSQNFNISFILQNMEIQPKSRLECNSDLKA